MLPLHKDAQGAQKGDNAHAGLWYDRFFNQYDDDCKVDSDGKINWIKKVAGEVGDAATLQAFQARQDDLIQSQGGQTLVMSSQWHFVTGMGNNHPVENGFAWHHTLGVPYLTGAAVKGMVRAWCEIWQGFDKPKVKQWFGDTDQSGELIFFDAVPTKPVQLKADIMTPHYGDWYAKGGAAPKADGSNVPADWHDPNPVPFLVVDKGQAFQFGIAKRAGSNINLSDVVKALTHALEYLGAGAKTAAGYGRMVTKEHMEKQSQSNAPETPHRSSRSQKLSPVEIAKQKMLAKKKEVQTQRQVITPKHDKPIKKKTKQESNNSNQSASESDLQKLMKHFNQ